MGVMQFLIHPPQVVDDCPEIYRAYVTGFDGRVFPTRIEIDGNRMTCRRPVSDSGKLHTAWPVEGYGQPVLSTSSLPEREDPYVLAVELARGTISQIRDQLGCWELQGMKIPAEFAPLHQQAQQHFASAVARQEQPEEASQLAARALETACRAADVLTTAYTRQRLAVEQKRSGKAPACLGCQLGRSVPTGEEEQRFLETFSAAVVPIEWRHIEPTEGTYHWDLCDEQVEWCEKHRLMTCGGPLIDLSPDGLPSWLWQWNQDVPNLQSFLCDFIETAIGRYHGVIRHWKIATRANSGGAMTLSEEDRLLLTASALDVARQVDEDLQLLLTVDQPWGEYQARGHHRLSPFQFVDALVRSGAGLSAVNLELGLGYRPCGTASRNRLAFSRLIDLWSQLGVPLYITVALPSGVEPDPRAEDDMEVVTEAVWKQPWSETAQAEWVREYFPLFLAKPSVMGIIWSHFSDALPHHYPHSGVLDETGRPKKVLQPLKELFANSPRMPLVQMPFED